jgi:hypothetical protein
MLTEDYLIRMINLAIATLLRIIGLKKEGDYQEALILIDMTFEQLLGLRASMAKGLDDNRLYYLLTRSDQLDLQRLSIIADLYHHEGEIFAAQGRAQESREDYIRALRYNLEVLFQSHPPDRGAEPGAEGAETATAETGPRETLSRSAGGTPSPVELIARIEELLRGLELSTLGADTLWPLAGYFEESGAYARAEYVLLLLVERADTRAEILPELIAFYERLLAIPAARLAEGGLTAQQVRESLARWRAEH